MRLLVLGGTRFLGRAVVDVALAGGWQVTTLTRGVSGTPPPEVDARIGDRATADGLAALGDDEWDVVIDTSGFVPRDVRLGARALAGRVGHYVFVSTVNVYPGWPEEPVTADSPVHAGDPDAGPDDGDYGLLKAGCERAVDEAFPGAATHNRSGLQIGPADNTSRLAWWLTRIARGGEVLAPGDPDTPIALVDTRDMAAWMLHVGAERIGGAYVVSAPVGTQTYGGMLAECVRVTGSDARLTWFDDDRLTAAGVEPWTELPLWLPAPLAGTAWDADVSAALRTGLRIRPFADSVADTWEWMRHHETPPSRHGLAMSGMDPARERGILAGRAANLAP